MSKKDAEDRIKKLRESIEKYRYSYHVLDKSDISDEALDSLKHELQQLEQEYPEFITPDSPTQRVGGKPLPKFSKVTHEHPMLSLTDAFSFDELKDWETRNKKLVPDHYDYYAELKIDGLAVSLIYENGSFTRGATRGDGRIGEDVTQNLKTIESIPLKLSINPSIQPSSDRIEIRGEVYLSKKNFEELNARYKKEGRPFLANPRNAAAGSIRQLDPKLAAERKLSFIAWDLFGVDFKTHEEEHKILGDLGFKTLSENRYCKDLSDVEKLATEIEEKRDSLPFQIDGLVININNNEIKEKLGVVGKAPRGAIAYKFAPEEATTIVEDIGVNVGRTGNLTPVAFLKPVLIAGTTVSRATLHNEDEIRKKDIRIGDTVVVHKAGDIIPEVEKVILELRPKDAQEFYFPKECPQCGGPVIREAGKAAYKCVNKNCFNIQRRSIEHFVSRAAFDIAGLGPKIINKFIDEGLIKDAADLFNLKEGDIQPLERFAEKSAQNIVNSIQAHKEIELPRFIYALGIPNVGFETAYDMAERIQNANLKSQNDIAKLLNRTTSEDWQEIQDIGPIVAKSIYDYFHDKHNTDFIKRLLDNGVIIKFSERSSGNGKLAGMSFVFTGGLETMTRDEAKQKVRELGGEPSESVSKETSYVVAGSDPGSKLSKAEKFGVKIISEEEFIELLRN